jgi:hypothetical protein
LIGDAGYTNFQGTLPFFSFPTLARHDPVKILQRIGPRRLHPHRPHARNRQTGELTTTHCFSTPTVRNFPENPLLTKLVRDIRPSSYHFSKITNEGICAIGPISGELHFSGVRNTVQRQRTIYLKPVRYSFTFSKNR